MKTNFLLLLLFSTVHVFGQSANEFVVSAHRGNSSEAPENTLIANQLAIESGADYLECDVRRTKDRVMVTLHDASLNRTTNARGYLRDMNYADLASVDAGYPSRFGNKYKGEKIPTLEEVLRKAKGKIRVEIEIKETGLADDVVKLVRKLKMEKEVIVISFTFSEIERVKTIAPNIAVKYLVGPFWGRRQLRKLNEIGGEYIGPNGVASTSKINLANSYGIKIISYTIDSEADMRRAIERGQYGIATNYPRLAVSLRDGNKSEENAVVANWEFDNASVGHINDASGFNNDAAINGTPQKITFNGVTGLNFDGKNDYAKVPSSASLDNTFAAITIMATVKLNRLPSQIQDRWCPIYDSGEDSYVLYLDKGAKELRFKVSSEGGSQRPGIPESELNTKDWITVYGVYDGTSAKIYLGNKLIDEHKLTGRITKIQKAYIGKNGSGKELFSGAVSDLRIYNYALSPDKMKLGKKMHLNRSNNFFEQVDGVNFDTETKFSVFPNPVKTGFYVNTPDDDFYNIQLLNIEGKELYNYGTMNNLSGRELKMPDSLREGYYVIEIRGKSEVDYIKVLYSQF